MQLGFPGCLWQGLCSFQGSVNVHTWKRNVLPSKMISCTDRAIPSLPLSYKHLLPFHISRSLFPCLWYNHGRLCQRKDYDGLLDYTKEEEMARISKPHKSIRDKQPKLYKRPRFHNIEQHFCLLMWFFQCSWMRTTTDLNWVSFKGRRIWNLTTHCLLNKKSKLLPLITAKNVSEFNSKILIIKDQA